MSPWISGDTLDSATLNARQASASSTAGFSSNTLQAESGQTLAITASLNLGGGAPGSYGVLSITSAVGHGRDAISISPSFNGGGGPLAIWAFPSFLSVGDTNGLGTASFGAGTIAGPGAAEQWNTLQLFQPGLTGGATVPVASNLSMSDVTIGSTGNFQVYSRRGHWRFGDTSRFTDGTATAPSVAMDSDLSLGLYKAAAGVLGVAGTTVMVASNTSMQGSLQQASHATLASLGATVNVSLLGGTGGSGSGQIKIGALASRPTVALANAGGILFVQAGALLFLGGSGSLTTIAPA